jgi:hypothetical protein
MYEVLNSQQQTQGDLNYATKNYFLKPVRKKTERNKIKQQTSSVSIPFTLLGCHKIGHRPLSYLVTG